MLRLIPTLSLLRHRVLKSKEKKERKEKSKRAYEGEKKATEEKTQREESGAAEVRPESSPVRIDTGGSLSPRDILLPHFIYSFLQIIIHFYHLLTPIDYRFEFRVKGSNYAMES